MAGRERDGGGPVEPDESVRPDEPVEPDESVEPDEALRPDRTDGPVNGGPGDGSSGAGAGGGPDEGPGSDGDGTGEGRDVGVRLPWVRVRLRSARATALATFGLVLITAFLAAALPRAVDRYEDRALRHAVQSGSVQNRGIALTATFQAQLSTMPSDPLAPSTLASVQSSIRSLLAPNAPLDPQGGVYGVRTSKESDVPDPSVARTSSQDPAADLVAQAGLDAQSRLVAGRMPHAPGVIREGEPPPPVDAAITERSAQVLHLKVGSVVHLRGLGDTPMTVHVTGIVVPRDPKAAYWNEDPDLLGPVQATAQAGPDDDPKTYWHFTLLANPYAGDSIPQLGWGANLYWYEPLQVGRLTAHGIPALQKVLSSLSSGPLAVTLQDQTGTPVRVGDSLGATFTAFSQERDATSPMVLIAAIGVGTTALAVLLMTGGLAAERRRGEITLLRSRGGSLRGIAGRLAGETAAAAVPGGAVGTLLALVLLPTERWRLPVLLAALVTAVVVLALPLRAGFAVRRPRPEGREDVATAKPSRRRLVVELTVVVLMAGAVVALRQRGGGGSGDSTGGSGSGGLGDDPFLAAAPVLVAIGAALVLLRLYPVPLRLLARPAARLRGAVTHLGLARAGRSPATGQLPLLAVLVALTVTSFGGSVLAGISHGRDRAATATVGADARIDALSPTLDTRLPKAVKGVPGVGTVTAARVEPTGGDGTAFRGAYDLVIVDPASYVELNHEIGLPSFPADALTGGHPGGTLPAVLSPGLAGQIGRKTLTIGSDVGTLTIRETAVVRATPAAPGSAFVIVSAADVAALHPEAAQYSQLSAPTTLLAMTAPGGRIDAQALRKAVKGGVTTASVVLRSQERAALADTPLQHGAHRLYLTAVAAGAGYSALALLLSLLQAAPGRATLLARLRTMGLTRGQARRLVLLEMLPQVLLGAVGGVLVGLAVIPLLGPGIDLRALAFGTGPRDFTPVDFGLGLRANPWALALPSAGLLILACVVLMAQAWATGRRRESTELRAGDRV